MELARLVLMLLCRSFRMKNPYRCWQPSGGDRFRLGEEVNTTTAFLPKAASSGLEYAPEYSPYHLQLLSLSVY